MTTPVPACRYVALGDSQTEGLLDPDGHGGYRGWADRFAAHLAASSPHLQYANLAVRGRLIAQIHDEQLAPALAMRPDLATVMAGLNDLLRPSFAPATVLARLDAMLSALRAAGAVVATNTFPDPAAISPLLRRLAPRVDEFNTGIRDIAQQRGAVVVDFARQPISTDARIWSPDRIHANPIGHARIAAAFADAVGLPGFADWAAPLPLHAPKGALVRTGGEARWVATTLVPWAGRRLRGRSSGDGVAAKRPRLTPVAPIFHLVRPGEWPEAGEYRPASLAQEGFVHFSFADQVEGPANRLFADAEQLDAVQLDTASLAATVVVEDSYGEGTEYPHVYGPVPVDAAVAVHPLQRDADGRWRFTDPGGAIVAASPDR